MNSVTIPIPTPILGKRTCPYSPSPLYIQPEFDCQDKMLLDIVNSPKFLKTMALHFLALPSPLHSHSSLHLSKSNTLSKLSLFSKSCSHHLILNRATQIIIQFNPQFSPLTTQAGSSPTEAATTSTVEEESSAEISDRRRLIAQNIPWTCTADDIRSLFEKHGTVLDVELSMHNKTMNRGLAFITMASEEDATAALNGLNSYDMDGRTIYIAYARSSKKSPPSEPLVPREKHVVYVGNLAWRVTSQDLNELFKSSGKVISARIIYETKPRRPAGYGFVSFASREEAEAAISTFNGQGFMGRPLNLGLSKIHADVVEGTTDEGEKSDEASSELNTDGEP